MTTSTVDKDVLVLGIVVLICISPSIIAWLVSIAGVSAAGTSTVAVGDISDGGTHGKEHDVNNKRRTSSKRHWLPPRRNSATSVRWMLLLGSMLVVAAHGNDRGVNVDENFVASDNQYPRSSESENADAGLIGNTAAVGIDSFWKTTFARDWLLGLFHYSASVDDPPMWWWGSTGAGRNIGIAAAIGAMGLSMDDTHVTALATAPIRPTVHSSFEKRKVWPFLALGTFCATWMALLAGSVFNSYPTREDVTKATVAWSNTLLMLVGSLNIVMPVVVAIARRDTWYIYSCCGRVKDKTVKQREGERGRKSEGESSDRIENELELAIEMETAEPVEPVETVSADSIGGRDGGAMGNGLTMATLNLFSLSMALAFSIVFGGFRWFYRAQKLGLFSWYSSYTRIL